MLVTDGEAAGVRFDARARYQGALWLCARDSERADGAQARMPLRMPSPRRPPSASTIERVLVRQDSGEHASTPLSLERPFQRPATDVKLAEHARHSVQGAASSDLPRAGRPTQTAERANSQLRMSTSPRTVEQLLQAIESGDDTAKSQLFAVLYRELHSRAARLVERNAKQLTLQATALINEAYLRLVSRPGAFVDRDHFLACAARAMRHILIDHARRPRPVVGDETPLDTVFAAFEEHAYDIEKLHVALNTLEQTRPEMVKMVELRFFGGASEEETARILGMSLRTMQREWRAARQVLKERCRDT